MSEPIDKMEDYLTQQSSYDRFPEAYEVREIYNKKVKSLEAENAELKQALKRSEDIFNEITRENMYEDAYDWACSGLDSIKEALEVKK